MHGRVDGPVVPTSTTGKRGRGRHRQPFLPLLGGFTVRTAPPLSPARVRAQAKRDESSAINVFYKMTNLCVKY